MAELSLETVVKPQKRHFPNKDQHFTDVQPSSQCIITSAFLTMFILSSTTLHMEIGKLYHLESV